MENIIIAILAKNKEQCLPLFLECIYNLDFNKKNIHLYIKTNDNTDNTVDILEDFIKNYEHEYLSVYFNKESINDELKNYKNHEWNSFRFKILSKIRQDSIDYAIKLNSHYFIVDCDNYITPNTLKNLYKIKDLGVIAPLIISDCLFSNFNYHKTQDGVYVNTIYHSNILNRNIIGIIEVKLVHCTYFINKNLLDKILYNDNSDRYEYIVFADNLNKLKIPQYIDNTEFYGFLNFADTKEEHESSLKKFIKYYPEFNKYGKTFKHLRG